MMRVSNEKALRFFEDNEGKVREEKGEDFQQKVKERGMDVTVKEFIMANTNCTFRWEINGKLFQEIYAIPDDLLNKRISAWTVNLLKRSIGITT